jgi:hypothetical protein
MPSGVEIDAESWIAAMLGFTVALEYNTDEISDCFFATFDFAETITYFKYDWEEMKTNYSPYNVFVYDPIHLMTNSVALSE